MDIKTVSVGNKKLFAFGDIHGCFTELNILIQYLEQNKIIAPDDMVVFLGDYIDRGANSFAVVDLLIDFKYKYPQTYFLKGNHESMFLNFLGFDARKESVFLYNGGLETILSYDIQVGALPETAVHKIPPLHFKFYTELIDILETEEFIFVHGGLDIKRKLSEQVERDTLWIRDEFITKPHEFGKTIIFGHTPFKEIYLDLPYKIGLDTGLVYGNKLTCLEMTEFKYYETALAEQEVVAGKIEKL
ncbi:MAG: serine/threonine protein phosphatase [Deltaproteobacteria bacterium]|jgi:serine/threonine protein phosphatase 1|nr:serine/threonine protein phosphatase [Deltaproteobacteria bacterium]